MKERYYSPSNKTRIHKSILRWIGRIKGKKECRNEGNLIRDRKYNYSQSTSLQNIH